MSSASSPIAVSAVLRIPLDQLQHGPNVRGRLHDIEDLAAQLRTFGQQQPITVVDAGEERYEVLDGNRRLAAARLAGLAHLDAVLRRPPTELERIERQLVMGMSGRNVSPLDEARAIEELMFVHHRTREQIAARFNRNPGWVRDRLALLQLDEAEQRDVARGTLSVNEALMRVRGRRHGVLGADPDRFRASPTVRERRPHCPTCACFTSGKGRP